MHVSDSRSWKGPLGWEGSPVRPAPPRHSLMVPNMEAKCHLQFIIELELQFFLSRDTIFYSHISNEKRRRKTDQDCCMFQANKCEAAHGRTM